MKFLFLAILLPLAALSLGCGGTGGADGDTETLCESKPSLTPYGLCLLPDGGWNEENWPDSKELFVWLHLNGTVLETGSAPLHPDCSTIPGTWISRNSPPSGEAVRLRFRDGDGIVWNFYYYGIPVPVALLSGDPVAVDCVVNWYWNYDYGACRIERSGELVLALVKGPLSDEQWRQLPFDGLSAASGRRLCLDQNEAGEYHYFRIDLSSPSGCASAAPGEMVLFPDLGMVASGYWARYDFNESVQTDSPRTGYEFFLVRSPGFDPAVPPSGYRMSTAECEGSPLDGDGEAR